MIYKLQRKFILISTVSIFTVVFIVFAAIALFSITSINHTLDILADSVSEGGGRFPDFGISGMKPGRPPQEPQFEFITPETPFSTRYFTVRFDSSGQVTGTNTDSIYAIDEPQALEYAAQAMEEGDSGGWISSYRYKIYTTEFGTDVVFIDGSANLAMLAQSMTIAGVVLLICVTLVLALIILFSKRAVKPIAESYEKQRQFITDANHELKTPLTLILANLDIAEEELGRNEWLEDIRAEGLRLTELVNRLVALSRMDEEQYALRNDRVPLGKLVTDTVVEFEPLAADRGKTLESQVDETVFLRGDEELLRSLLAILLDNAIKYCDPGGQIVVRLIKGRHITLTVENTYAAVGDMELHRLFDRFYRADRARTFTGGYGVGLSMAKSIVEKHKGSITAYQKDDTHIGFKVTL
ncbi:MAG: HAMP domain-containing histidine kinase [Ruminococcaceae bacterium]|nr:HAMP domain-containing histidine kinase [Oscillospiraceae bacterium]